CARMKSIVHLAEARLQHMRVDLRRRQIRMPEHGLNRAQVRAALKQVRCEGMPEHVRTQRAPYAGRTSVRFEQLPETNSRHPPAVPCVDEQPWPLAPFDERSPRVADVSPDPFNCLIAERHDALLVSLTHALHVALLESHVGESQIHELGHAQAS